MATTPQPEARVRPPKCDFATRYVVIKIRWSLTVDPPEKAALADMLQLCS